MMTNQVNQAFEKWCVEKLLCDDNGANFRKDCIGNYYYTLFGNMFGAWQAAPQDRESEINALNERVEELQAHINDLREAFRKIRSCYGDRYEVDNIARQAISKTPAQSLAERKEEYGCKLMSECTDPNL